MRGRGGKPWARVLAWRDDGPAARCSWDHLKRRAYLRAALAGGGHGLLGEAGSGSACARAFETVRVALESGLDASACCEQMGWSAPIGHYGSDLVPVF